MFRFVWLRYGFIVMEGCSKDVFFHVNDVHSEEELALKRGDEVTFIFNKYRKRGTDVQLWLSFLLHRSERLDYELKKLESKLKTPPLTLRLIAELMLVIFELKL